MIIQHCSPICETNPPVIVQFFEFDDIDRPDRFAWDDAVSDLCGVWRSTPVSVQLTWRAQVVLCSMSLFVLLFDLDLGPDSKPQCVCGS